jgi:hypothetical protein
VPKQAKLDRSITHTTYEPFMGETGGHYETRHYDDGSFITRLMDTNGFLVDITQIFAVYHYQSVANGPERKH